MIGKFFWAMLVLLPVPAIGEQVPEAIQVVIREAVDARVAAEGQAVELSFPLWRGKEQACTLPLEVSSSSARLRGKVLFRLRCANPVWSVSVPVRISLPGEYWVAARFLPVGTVLAVGDLRRANGDLAALPEDVVRSDSAVIGKLVTRAVPAGAAMGLNALRENAVIKAGERVSVNLLGSGFSVIGEGTALTGGAVGEGIRVKTRDGQQLVGRVVKAGMVEVILE